MMKKILIQCIMLCGVTHQLFAQSSNNQKEHFAFPGVSNSMLDSIISTNLTNSIISTNLTNDNAGDNASTWFNNFNAGLGVLGSKTSADIGVTLRRFDLFLGTKTDTVDIISNGTKVKVVRERDRNFYFTFLNRAAINFDSLKFIANTYLLSLNPSPLTFRTDYTFYLTKNRTIEVGKKSTPVVAFQLQADGRVIPFATKSGVIDVGGSFNAFGTLQFLFKSYERQGNEVKDEGTFYIEPSFYFVASSNSLMETVKPNSSDNYLMGIDFKLGFKSEKNAFNDIGISGYYTWEKITGPTFRLGLAIKPN